MSLTITKDAVVCDPTDFVCTVGLLISAATDDINNILDTAEAAIIAALPGACGTASDEQGDGKSAANDIFNDAKSAIEDVAGDAADAGDDAAKDQILSDLEDWEKCWVEPTINTWFDDMQALLGAAGC